MNLSHLDIIAPCYNPLTNWEQNIITSFNDIKIKLKKISINLILVNDGSTINVNDKTIKLLKNNIANFSFISYSKNMGKGYAVRKGIEKSKGRYQIIVDVDFPYTTESIINIYHSLQKGVDVALGYRKADYYHQVPYTRKVISKLFRRISKRIFRLSITDTQCGLKGFGEKGKIVFLKTKTNGYLYDLEYAMLIKKKGLIIKPVVVRLKNNITFTKMRIKVLIRELFNFFNIIINK